MKLALLSCSPQSYSSKRLVEAATKRGHTVELLNTLRLTIGLDHGDPSLYYFGEALETPDAIIPRIGTSITRYGTAVVRQFEQMEIYTPNTSAGISNSRDKLRSLQILSRHDVGIPTTAYVDDKRDLEDALKRVGGAPVIIKLLEGTQGVGVILADKIEIARAIVETLHSTKQQVLLQKFVAESKGKDVRAFVIGDRVVAAIRRTAQGQEFRSNIHRGGKAEKISLCPAYEEAAVRAAQIMGLRICGVDMLESEEGPQVMEINSSPGLQGIESCTGLDIAGEIIDYIEDQIQFPEIDIRQRLTVSRGYSVADIHIPIGSALIGMSLDETKLRDHDVVVLTLRRDGKVISNPKGNRILEADDTLLCYGRSEHMKGLIVKKKMDRKIRKLNKAPVVES